MYVDRIMKMPKQAHRGCIFKSRKKAQKGERGAERRRACHIIRSLSIPIVNPIPSIHIPHLSYLRHAVWSI